MNCKIQAHFDRYSIGMGHIVGGLISFGQWHKDPLVKCFVEGMLGETNLWKTCKEFVTCQITNLQFMIYDNA